MDETFAKKLFLGAIKNDRMLEALGIADDSIPEEEDIGVTRYINKGDGVFEVCVYIIDIPIIGIVTYDSLGKWADVHFFASVGGVMLHNVE